MFQNIGKGWSELYLALGQDKERKKRKRERDRSGSVGVGGGRGGGGMGVVVKLPHYLALKNIFWIKPNYKGIIYIYHAGAS